MTGSSLRAMVDMWRKSASSHTPVTQKIINRLQIDGLKIATPGAISSFPLLCSPALAYAGTILATSLAVSSPAPSVCNATMRQPT
jgi:hypothetical protein